MKVLKDRDGGNIEAVGVEYHDKTTILRLNIRKDNKDPRYQFFNFRFEGSSGKAYQFRIENAGGAAYPKWNDHLPYRALASYDGETWFRVPTKYDAETGHLTISIESLAESKLHVAFSPPFSYAKHQALMDKALELIPDCQRRILGQSTEGRDITLLTVGTPGPNKKNYWIIARQHPGETMAEWFMKAFIEAIAELKKDPNSADFFEQVVFFLVPNMNPDGTYHGNLRTNAAGEDLNRCWLNPDLKKSPEVFLVRQEMQKEDQAPDFFLDVHQDEEHPEPFVEGRGEGCSANAVLAAMENEFVVDFVQFNPDLKGTSCYEPDLPGQANLSMAVSHVAEMMNCVSLLLEMPFKELKTATGSRDWNLPDCQKLAQDFLKTLQRNVTKLHRVSPPNQDLSNASTPILARYHAAENASQDSDENSFAVKVQARHSSYTGGQYGYRIIGESNDNRSERSGSGSASEQSEVSRQEAHVLMSIPTMHSAFSSEQEVEVSKTASAKQTVGRSEVQQSVDHTNGFTALLPGVNVAVTGTAVTGQPSARTRSWMSFYFGSSVEETSPGVGNGQCCTIS